MGGMENDNRRVYFLANLFVPRRTFLHSKKKTFMLSLPLLELSIFGHNYYKHWGD